jgi:long-chain acyl-CoA synthetase
MSSASRMETELTRDIQAERAKIEAAIEGKTLLSVFADTVDRHADEPALNWKTADGWQSLTWAEYRQLVRQVALGLCAIGLRPGEFGVIMARNRPEHLVADLAIMHARGIPVSLYNTLAAEQVQYITGHCDATVAFVEDAGFLAKFQEVREQLPKLRKVVVMDPAAAAGDDWLLSWDELLELGRAEDEKDPEAFDRAWRSVQPHDLATLIYTSGTTGPPKGAMDSHRQVLWMCECARDWLPRPSTSRHLSYLPFAHAFERFTGHWYLLYCGYRAYFCTDTALIFAYAGEVKPNAMIGVPRVWEKLHAALNAGIAAEPDEQRRAAVQGAVAAGVEIERARQRGEAPSPEQLAAAEKCRPVWKALLGKVGLDECDVAITGAAPINPEVIEFFRALELPLVEGWGMTETTVGATFSPSLDQYRNGTVGVADFGVALRLADDGEILVQGGNVIQGYYKEPEKTAEAIDADGWLHTGDIGTMDEDGYVRIIDRKKELIITAGGKNISPANLEALLKQHPLVGQACAIGDRRPYITALIVLDQEVLPVWARQHGIEFTSTAELAGSPEVTAELQRAVDECNRHVAQVESVRKFTALPVEWTAESEELTPTLKLKRRVVHEKYGSEIDAMYQSQPVQPVLER